MDSNLGLVGFTQTNIYHTFLNTPACNFLLAPTLVVVLQFALLDPIHMQFQDKKSGHSFRSALLMNNQEPKLFTLRTTTCGQIREESQGTSSTSPCQATLDQSSCMARDLVTGRIEVFPKKGIGIHYYVYFFSLFPSFSPCMQICIAKKKKKTRPGISSRAKLMVTPLGFVCLFHHQAIQH
ncbi:hypothetical protein QBC32DRAFT_128959 [Pseudoneurospora amorphoporcata]|uniref:Uncharacterized protein n=1 Tax=Pseudoneurospora amorphoporcata TaxID=241081 RepID=A0AAN6NXS5_9PEZI|nr:hypothetical protein QBC32DRAFT_128959 [Pseudoneurospora amorphoporcata]